MSIRIVNRQRAVHALGQLGFDPITIATIASAVLPGATDFAGKTVGPAVQSWLANASGQSALQSTNAFVAAQAAQERADAEATRTKWLVGGGVVLGALFIGSLVFLKKGS